MRAVFVSLSFLIGQALAGVFITSPTGATTAAGGSTFTIQWKDDGAAPSLADIGPCEVGIYVGNQIQQTEVFQISDNLDVSKTTSFQFPINPSIGPNSGQYFIRFTSNSLKDAAQPQFNYQSFSSKFTLSGMSGQFAPQAQSQIDGASTAGTIGGAATSTSSSSSTSGLSTVKTTSTSSTRAPAATGNSTTTKANNTSSASALTSGFAVAIPVALLAAISL